MRSKTLGMIMVYVALIICGAVLGYIGYDYISNKLNNNYKYTLAEKISVSSSTTQSDLAEELYDASVQVVLKSETGSGICISEDGYIVTNHHVIETHITNSSNAICISTSEHDYTYAIGTTNVMQCELIWYNADLDLAIIKASGEGIPKKYCDIKDRSIACAETDRIRLLEDVIAIGTPIDHSLFNTIVAGKVSGVDRLSTVTEGMKTVVYEDLIQHTAPTNPGNSGGALVDLKGNVIAINTLGLTTDNGNNIQGVLYSVPIYPVVEIMKKITADSPNFAINTGTILADIGINGNDTDMYYSNYTGRVEINEPGFIIKNCSTLGSANGFFEYDIITKISFGTKIYNISTRNDLIYALICCGTSDNSNNITITFTRGYNNKTVSIGV